MGALINGCILGVHGGIGKHIEGPEQIAAMQRPLRMGGTHGSLLLDLLWSDPTSSDSVHGVHTNVERGHPVVCFGPDRVASFLERNGLSLIVRAHECVMDGFQRFAGGRLITIFSATNYCNRWGNAGAILQIGKDLEITPKSIYPLEDLEDAWLDAVEPKARVGAAGGSARRAGSAGEDVTDLREMRPPTPPRDDHDGAPRESPRRSRGGESSPRSSAGGGGGGSGGGGDGGGGDGGGGDGGDGVMLPPPRRRMGSMGSSADSQDGAGGSGGGS